MYQADATLTLPLDALDPIVRDGERPPAVDWQPSQIPAGSTAHAEPPRAEAVATKGFPLMMADEGLAVRILAVRAGKGLALRLTDLGLNIGTELRVLQRQGGGLLVARGATRIALGGGMAAKILVAPVA
ncbi:FeoA family protein [Thiococcus pfennigii]|uniref:FeoA family protein n=1 Tax=Thiococcus pfennigii TaxID=1057 RepID=UPI001902FBB8|nr:FeoA family protein [Thiococcus pfennigii]MBK1730814.1 hypothetical protein [Thiococcus pfennigii]